MEPQVAGELGMEAQPHREPLAHPTGSSPRRAITLAPLPTLRMRGARMNTPAKLPPTAGTSTSALKESIWRP